MEHDKDQCSHNELKKDIHNLNEKLLETHHENKNLIVQMKERMNSMEQKFEHMRTQVINHYVTKHEFSPIKIAVYGFIALLTTALVFGLGSLIYMLLSGPK